MDALRYLVDVKYSRAKKPITSDGIYRRYDAQEQRYIYLHMKDEPYGLEKFRITMELLELYYVDSQYTDEELTQRIKCLGQIEIELDESAIVHENLTETRYPLFTVKGSCQKQKCFYPQVPVDNLIPIPCCFDKRISYQRISRMDYPLVLDMLLEVLNWVVICPTLYVVFILHDSPANTEDENLTFELCIQVKGNHIRVVTERSEIQKLYKEYTC